MGANKVGKCCFGAEDGSFERQPGWGRVGIVVRR